MKYDSIYHDVTSYEVEALVLYIDNTQEFANRRDNIYKKYGNKPDSMKSEFHDVNFLLAATCAYKHMTKETTKLNSQQKEELVAHYVSQYQNWLIDNPSYNTPDDIIEFIDGDIESNVIQALSKCTVDGNIIRLPKGKLSNDVFRKTKERLEKIGGSWKGGKIGGFVYESDPSKLLEDISSGKKRNIQKETQLYQTSKGLVDKVKGLIKWRNNKKLKVLEPSAGRGMLLTAFDGHEDHVDIDMVELDASNREYLNKYFVDLNENMSIIGDDFLSIPIKRKAYDLIIANPPYAANQDIKHVNHMMNLLVPGGQLITFMSVGHLTKSDKLSTEFRNRITEEFNGDYIEIDVDEWENNGAKARTVLYNLVKRK